MPFRDTAEHRRLQDSEDRRADWKNWGPYLAERAWGTVREDYSATGEAWDYFPHDHARSRAYRWNEDGIGGFCNRFQNVCLAHAFWNENDPIIKERLFGLTGSEGNHGEDVKELYYYQDGTPTHSYMKMLYIYPHAAFPYAELVERNRESGVHGREIELWEILELELTERRFFEITIEYAKASDEDLLCRITATNCGPDAAPLHILPHLFYRNSWSWDRRREPPLLEKRGPELVYAEHHYLGERYFYVHAPDFAAPTLLFCDNETNYARLYGQPNTTLHPKDAINDAVVNGDPQLAAADRGTKAAAHFSGLLPRETSVQIWLRLSPEPDREPFSTFEGVFERRIAEADEFFDAIQQRSLDEEQRSVQRQALAGLLWSKQFYHFGVGHWLHGDSAQPAPPQDRTAGRNSDWTHVYALDVISMPDKWEYPWFAAWDLAFHVIPLALVDPEWAKRQLILLLREWYMHPSGQIPAYEWAFDDVNPPVHAWSALQVYKLTRESHGGGDTDFLERIFHKLLLNFTWWVNRKDIAGNNIFQGGFLGLDNIGVFDRSKPLPTGGHLDQ
ncbi:MAG: glucosidase, partial [Myxococcales bacterium]|nr:glucosidase [Myxococcales bacterium]